MKISKGAFSQENILTLYKRFRTLDRNKRGYLVSSDVVDSIPELSINPLKKRIAYFCDGINFKEFVRILAPYSPRATRHEKVKAMFAVWDVNGDGRVCREDVELVMREAAGGHLRDGEVSRLVERTMEACEERLGKSVANGMTLDEFMVVLGDFADRVELNIDL